jgi:hypothetical protein
MSWMLFAVLAVLATLALAALAVLLREREPWDLEATPERFRALETAYEKTLRALKDLEYDHRAGTLSAGEYEGLRVEYKERAVGLRRALERSRQVAVRRIVAGRSAAPSAEERRRIEDLVAAARAASGEGAGRPASGITTRS